MQADKLSKKIINKPARVMRNAFIVAVLMIAGAVITGYSGFDGMNGGFALIFAFGFLAMIALITALVYIPRAREFTRLVNQLNPLAHWTYTQEEWDSFIKENQKEMMSTNRKMLRMVIIIAIAVCGILLLIYQDSLFLVIVAGIILFISLVAFIAPLIRTQLLKKGIHEAYIGPSSAWVGGTFQTWRHLGAHLIAAGINAESSVPMLQIKFEFPTLQAMQQETVRIPVPAGKMEEAKKIADTLSHSN